MFEGVFFAKKTTFAATTATYCHLAKPLNKGGVAEWQYFSEKNIFIREAMVHGFTSDLSQ